MLTLNDGRSELWQWDTGRTLAVDVDCSQVHFSNKVFGRSIDVDVVDGAAIIPDILLQTDKDLNVWAFVGTAENGYTKISKTFKVNRRNKPADYVFTPTDQTTLAELSGRIDRIEESQDPEAIKNAVKDYLEQNPVEAPVQSVNGQIGAVELTAKDVGAISQGDLQTAANEVLAQAKASGEFDGADGSPGQDGQPGADGVGIQSVVQTTTSTEDGGANIVTVTKTDGTSSTFSVKNGSKGSTGQAGTNGADGKSAYAYAVEGGYTGTEAEFAAKLAAEKFANPNALTFTGAATGSYDGSAPLSVEIPSGGGGSSGNDTIDILMDVTIAEAVAAVTVTLDTPRAYKELYIATCVYGDESNSSANAMFLRVNNTGVMGDTNAIAWIPSVENATSATSKSYGIAFVKLLDDCSFYYCYGSKSANARTPQSSYGEKYTVFNKETIISTLKFQSVNQWTNFGVGSTIKVYGVRS